MLTTVQATDDPATLADQSQGDQTLQSRQIDTPAQLIARLIALEEENKTLKATVEGMRTPPIRSLHVLEQTDKKGDQRQDQTLRSTRRDLLLNTGVILGRQKDMISPIRRLDALAFDKDNDVEEILLTLPQPATIARPACHG